VGEPPRYETHGSVNRKAGHVEAALARPEAVGTLERVSNHGRFSHEVTGLIDLIRKLVAEQRGLERTASNERLEANRLEIDRLKLRLASAVQRELAG